METSNSFYNQINNFVFPFTAKESRHGKHKDPAYKKKWRINWLSNPANLEKNRAWARAARKKNYIPKRKPKTFDELLDKQFHLYNNWFKVFGGYKTFRKGHLKDGSDVWDSSLLTPKAKENKNYLKVVPGWKNNKRTRINKGDNPLDYLKDRNGCIMLDKVIDNEGYKAGCLDVEVPGFTALAKSTRYVSNRRGPFHLFFKYKINDMNSKTGVNSIKIKNFKADFKISGYMISPLSLHRLGGIYQIKGISDFFNGRKFEKASEAYAYFISLVIKLQQQRENRKQERLLKAQIQILPKQ